MFAEFLVLPRQIATNISRSMLRPIMHQQFGWRCDTIEQSASHESIDQIIAAASPFQSSSNHLWIVSADLSGQCMLGRESPQQTSEAKSVRPRYVQDHSESANLG